MTFNNFFKSKRKSAQQAGPIPPEEYWEVQVEDGILTMIDPDRRMRSIKLSDIHTISITTNDQGLWIPDAYMAFDGNSFGYAQFPVGCIGYDDVYNVISTFKGFDFDQVIKAMSSTENRQFIVWTNTNQYINGR